MASGVSLTTSGVNNPDSVVTDGTSVVFTVSNNSTITIVSAAKRTMSFSQPAGANQLNTALTCNANDSTYTITNPTSGATGLQITVTPTTNTCTGSGTSGGTGSSGGAGSGGGGGASASPSPAPTPAPVATVTLPTPSAVGTAPVVPSTPGTNKAVAVMISRQIKLGERSDDVKRVQEAFSGDKSVYPEGLKTGLFGPATKRAVQRFQEKYGVAGKSDVGYGNFGPKTRAKFNEIYGGTASASAPASSPATLALINTLLLKIAELQAALKALK